MTQVAHELRRQSARDGEPGPAAPQEKPNIYGRLARASARRPIPVILVYVLLATAGLISAFFWLDVDTDPQRMISDDLPWRQDVAEFRRAFPLFENNFVVTVESEDPERAREAARELAHAFEARPGLFRAVFAPGTSEFFNRYGILYLSPEQVTQIVAQLQQALPTISALAEEPNMVGMADLVDELRQAAQFGAAPPAIASFFAEAARTVESIIAGSPVPLDWTTLGAGSAPADQQLWLVIVKPKLDYTSLEPAQAALRSARSVINEVGLSEKGQVEVALTGEAALNAEELQVVTEGATLAGIISFVVVTGIILFGFPAKRLVVPAVVMLALGFLITAGFATITVGYLNLISVAFAVLFIGLGVDYAVHVILRYSEEVRSTESVQDAIAASAQHTGPALMVILLTTVLAFLAFTPTAFTGMAQLGIIAAGGIVIAFLASLTLVPAVMALLGRPKGDKDLWLANLQRADMIRRLWIVRAVSTGIVLVLAALALLTLPHVRFHSDPIALKDPSSPAVVAFEELLTEAPSIYAAQVLSEPGEPARELAQSLESLPTVAEVRTIDTLVPENQEQKLADLATLQGLIPEEVATGDIGPEARRVALERLKQQLQAIAGMDAAPQELRQAADNWHEALVRFDSPEPAPPEAVARLERAFFGRFSDLLQRLQQLATVDPVTLENVDPNLKEHYVGPDGRWRLEVVPAVDMRDEANMRRFAAEVTSVAPHAVGAPVEIVAAADAVSYAMIVASAGAFILVVLILLPMMARVLDVALVMIPLILAALLLAGYTVVANTPFNFANVIVLPLLVGLGVHASIHYVMRAREEAGEHEIAETSTPRAVLLSAFTTIGSFGTLWLSSHRGVSSMGELLTVAIVITLVCTLLVLPQLISWTIGRKEEPLTDKPAATNRGRRGGS